MIVKTTRWKQKNIDYLINYIDNDKGKSKNKEQTFSIFHNISHPNLKSAQEAFKINETYRKKRKNGVVIYHEILSFHQKDNTSLDLLVLEDIAHKYIEIRGNNALCFAKPHLNDTNIHIHFAFSGTEYKCSRTLRMDNKTFKENRKAIEQYQMEHYPDLINSIVYHNSREKKRTKDKEYQTKKRTGKNTDKEILTDVLKEHFNTAKSFDKFCTIIEKKGFELYKYRDKVNGIIYNNRKYRFKTLGFGADLFCERQQIIDEFKELQPGTKDISIEKDENIPEQAKVQGFKQEIEQIQNIKRQRGIINRFKNLQANIRHKINNSISKLSTRIRSRLLGKNR